MADLNQIQPHMEVIGADGARVGTVDGIEGGRIKLTKADSGSHVGHHHFIPGNLVAGIDGNQVRLSATGANATLFEEEQGGEPLGEQSVFTWKNIGLGAAAAGVAVAAGAFFYQRRGRAEEYDVGAGRQYEGSFGYDREA
jgi:hypothetical protein